MIELCGASLRTISKPGVPPFSIFDLRGKAKIKCSDMRRFGISFFLFFLLSAQNSMAQDFLGWPNFNSVPETTKNPGIKTQATR
jgi:hypothetical protein